MFKFLILFILYSLLIFQCSIVNATPSTQIWIPSTDFQKFGTYHLGIDDFIRVHNLDNNRGDLLYDMGLTAGLLPWNKLQAEAGIDFIQMGDYLYDQNPIYFNIKIGTPEGSLFKGSPAIVAGAYNVGTKNDLTNFDLAYGLIAKTIPVIGRFSAGYYAGNDKVLLDENMNKANTGLLLSWDRPMNEISKNLWFGIDYQGGNNYMGSLNFGVSWSFTPDISVLLGYCVYNDARVMYNTKDKNVNTFTTQLDINFK